MLINACIVINLSLYDEILHKELVVPKCFKVTQNKHKLEKPAE